MTSHVVRQAQSIRCLTITASLQHPYEIPWPADQTKQVIHPEGRRAKHPCRTMPENTTRFRRRASARKGCHAMTKSRMLIILCHVPLTRSLAFFTPALVENSHAIRIRAPYARTVATQREPHRAACRRGSSLHMGFWRRDGNTRNKNNGSTACGGGRERNAFGRWSSRLWEQLASQPVGRAHDEVTFRSGREGKPHSIPQG